MPSASDLRDILPPASPSTETPTSNAQGPTRDAEFDLKRPPAGKNPYATQAQAMAAAALAQAQARGQGQGQGQSKGPEDENRDGPVSGAATTNPTSTSTDTVNTNPNAPTEPALRPPAAAPAPTRRIIQIEPPSHQSKSKRPHSSHPDLSTGPGGNGAEKMDGLTRELYALIGDNAPSLAQVRAELAGLSSAGSGAGSGSGLGGGGGGGRRWEVGKRGGGEGRKWYVP